MGRLFKWIVVAVATVVVLVVVVSTVLYYTVDERELKEQLVAAADRELDARLRIDGELALSVLPSLQLALGDVRLTGPGESTEEIASARDLRFGADLWPLLRGRLSISELTLEGLRLRLQRDADGRANWESLRRAPATPPTGVGQTPPDDAGDAASPLDLALEHVRIEDGTVEFRDQRAGTHYRLQVQTLRSEGLNLQGEPFRVETNARLVIDEGRQDLQLALATELRADRRAQTIALANSTARLARSGGPAVDIALPALDIALDRKRLEAQPFTLRSDMLEGNATLALDWSDPAEMKGNGALHIARLDLPRLAQALAIALPPALNPQPLAAMGLDATLAQTGDTIRLTDLRLRAGELSIEGELAYTGSEPARLDAKLSSPALDIDYLLPPPPPGEERAGTAPPSGAAPGDAPETPTALADLLKLAGRIELAIGALERRGLELGDVKVALVMQPGTVALEQLRATLYGGTLEGSGKLDARAAGKLALDAEFASVEVRALLAATRQPERMTGALDGTLALKATGTTTREWIASLAGPLAIEVHEPVLREMSVQKSVCTAVATLNKEMLSAEFPADTRLDKLAAALDFSAGVGKIRTLNATLPDMALEGKGTVDLPERRLAIQLDARVTRDLADLDPACRMTRKMQKIEWPLTCKGSFDEPAKKWCRIDDDDLARIATQVAGEKLKDKLKEKLGDFLRSN